MNYTSYVGDVRMFNRFALCGVEERHEAGERILYGPVGIDRATFLALECQGKNVEDKFIEFEKGLDPEEVLNRLLMNEHIAKHGVARLY